MSGIEVLFLPWGLSNKNRISVREKGSRSVSREKLVNVTLPQPRHSRLFAHLSPARQLLCTLKCFLHSFTLYGWFYLPLFFNSKYKALVYVLKSTVCVGRTEQETRHKQELEDEKKRAVRFIHTFNHDELPYVALVEKEFFEFLFVFMDTTLLKTDEATLPAGGQAEARARGTKEESGEWHRSSIFTLGTF